MDRTSAPANAIDHRPRALPGKQEVGRCFGQNVVAHASQGTLLTSPIKCASSLAEHTITLQPAKPGGTLRWDAKSYQQHSLSQANDSTGLVNFLLSSAVVQPPLSQICDLGCGTGQNMTSYQRTFNADVYGADPSPAMCAQAQASLSDMPIQCRGAQDFSFDVAFPLILSTHALHWITKAAMPAALSNIYAQLTDGGTFAAVFAASKAGLPFDDALQSVKAQEKYQTAFSNFTLNQYFYSDEEMVALLHQARFHIHTLVINPVDKTFANRSRLLGFVRQWLSESKHLEQNYPTLAEDFLNDVITNYLTRTAQQPDNPVAWQERTFTLVAQKINDH